MRRLILGLVATFFALPVVAVAQSDSPNGVRLICRGTNIPAHIVLMKRAVKRKLESENIEYRRVGVRIGKIRRPKGVLNYDYASDLFIAPGGDVPTVTYNGEFPTPESCEVEAKLKIFVSFPSGRSLTTSDVRIPGTLLWVNPRLAAVDLD